VRYEHLGSSEVWDRDKNPCPHQSTSPISLSQINNTVLSNMICESTLVIRVFHPCVRAGARARARARVCVCVCVCAVNLNYPLLMQHCSSDNAVRLQLLDLILRSSEYSINNDGQHFGHEPLVPN
jgi:hypothetical protein